MPFGMICLLWLILYYTMIYAQYTYKLYKVYASITILYVYLNLNLRDLDYSRNDLALAVGGNWVRLGCRTKQVGLASGSK